MLWPCIRGCIGLQCLVCSGGSLWLACISHLVRLSTSLLSLLIFHITFSAASVFVILIYLRSLVRYLQRVKSRNKLDHERVVDRLGFVFKQYREEYLFCDVIEVLRKLYLVTVVLFLPILARI